MVISINPLVFEIEDEDIEVFRSAEISTDIYVSFKWLYQGKYCGRAYYINGAEFEVDKYYTAAYEIADILTSSLSNYYARIFRLDNSNHVGPQTRDLVATKIINLYKGASENG